MVLQHLSLWRKLLRGLSSQLWLCDWGSHLNDNPRAGDGQINRLWRSYSASYRRPSGLWFAVSLKSIICGWAL